MMGSMMFEGLRPPWINNQRDQMLVGVLLAALRAMSLHHHARPIMMTDDVDVRLPASM
jgi:hypothetical protein